MGTLRILEPVTSRSTLAGGTLQAIDSLQGKTIGMLSNEWRCVKIMFDYLPGALKAHYGARAAFKETIELSLAGPQELLDDVGGRCDAVIVAMAN